MSKDYIHEAFDNQPVVIVSGKKYCINPLTDHIPATQPVLLRQITSELQQELKSESFDLLVGEEDRGGYICALASLALDKPFTLTKWNPSGFEGETAVQFSNAYTSGNLYLNGIKEFAGKKAYIVEDLIDTGGTIIAMIELLRKNNIEVVGVVAVAEKIDYKGIENIALATGIIPKTLVSFCSDETRTKVIKRST